jgi:hypothetical protein
MRPPGPVQPILKETLYSLSVTLVALQVCLNCFPFVIGTIKWFKTTQTCFLLLIEELYYHVITLVAVEYYLKVTAHGDIPESKPTVTNLIGRNTLSYPLNAKITDQSHKRIIMTETKVGCILACSYAFIGLGNNILYA